MAQISNSNTQDLDRQSYALIGKTIYKLSASLAPPVVALARTLDASISSSTEVTLNAATTFVRVYAIAQDVYLRWGTSDVSASDFDQVIPAGQIVDLIVPSGQTALNVIERVAGATVIVLEY